MDDYDLNCCLDSERPHGQPLVDWQQRPGGGEKVAGGWEVGGTPQEGLREAAEVNVGVKYKVIILQPHHPSQCSNIYVCTYFSSIHTLE